MSDTLIVNTSTENINITVIEGGSNWGTIGGSLSSQTDLYTYLVALSNATNTDFVLITANVNAINTLLLSNSGYWNDAYNTSTTYKIASGSFVQNVAFGNYQTNVTGATAILLPTSVYQNASSLFVQNVAFGNYQTNIANATATLVSNTAFGNYQTNVTNATGTLVTNSAFGNYQTNVRTATATLVQNSAFGAYQTNVGTATATLVTNTAFGNYQTNVGAATATLLPTTVYQNNSGSFIQSVSGTANQINVTKTGSTVTLSLPASTVFPGDVAIAGNLSIAGTATYVNTQNLVVGDNLIYFNDNNYGSNVLDVGIVAHFSQAPLGYNHTGLVRRAGGQVPGVWTLFSGLTAEPLSAANIDWNDKNIRIDSLSANLIGNVTGNADTVTNGVYTNGSYADPSWITSLADTKITGTKFTTNNSFGAYQTNVTNATSTLVQNSAFGNYQTNVATTTGTLVQNSAFGAYQTNVATATGTLLPTTAYQNNSGSFVQNSAFSNYQTNVATSTATLVTNTAFGNYQTNVRTATATLVQNSAFGAYQTNVGAATGTLVQNSAFGAYQTNITNTTATLVQNSAFGRYQTNVATATGTLLPLAGGVLTGRLGVNNVRISDNYFDLNTVSIGNPVGDFGIGSSGNVLISPNNNLILNQNVGNVGIGTNTPSQKLDVAGNIRVVSSTTNYAPLAISAYNLPDGVGILNLEGSEPDINFNQVGGTGYNTFTFSREGDAKLAIGRNSSNDLYITRITDTNIYDDAFILSHATGDVSIAGNNINLNHDGSALFANGAMTIDVSGNTKVNSLTATESIYTSSVIGSGTEVVLSDGASDIGHGDSTLSLNFLSGVFVSNTLSASIIRSGTYYGDGSHLTGISTVTVYTNGNAPYTDAITTTDGNNVAAGHYSNIGGGTNNSVNANCSSILGGSANCVCGTYSAIVGGQNNCITNLHTNSFILGSNIHTTQSDTTYVNNLSTAGSVKTGSVTTPLVNTQQLLGRGSEVVISDGDSDTGNGDSTLSLNFLSGVYINTGAGCSTYVNNLSSQNNIIGSCVVAACIRVNQTPTTFANPVRASGSFLIVNINGVDKAIQLWDFTS